MKIVVQLFMALFLLSCNRMADNNLTQVSIQLPKTGLATNLQSLPSNNLSLLDTGSSAVDPTTDNYSDLVPSGFAVGTTQINCYLVAVTGPETSMNTNYCGLRGTDNQISKTYTFGTYIGLRKANDTLVIDVPSGDARSVLIFGYHSVDDASCTNITTLSSKSGLTYPYFLGKSAPVRFEPAKDITVSVDMASPVDANRVDDCQLNDTTAQPRLATAARIITQEFPFNVLRKPVAGINCEPLDIALLSDTGTLAAGQLPVDSVFNLTQGNSLIPLNVFDSYTDCASLSPTTTSAFIVPKFRSNKKIWLRLTSTTPTTSTYRLNLLKTFQFTTDARFYAIDTVDQTLQSYTPTSNFIFDVVPPNKIDIGDCYPLEVSYRTLTGDSSGAGVSGTQFYMTATDPSGTSIGKFYASSNCSSQQTSFPIANGSSTSSPVYLKLDSTNARYFNLNVFQSGGTATILPIDKTIVVRINQNPSSITPVLSRLRIVGESKVLSTVDTCVPITVQFIDQFGMPYIDTGTSIYSIQASNSGNNLAVYAYQSCTLQVTGGSIVFGSSSHTFSAKILAGTEGDQTITFTINGVVKRSLRFNASGIKP